MPIYEYQCTACGQRHDALQKISDAALTDCPACGEVALSKVLTAAGFQLKGSGWYATDFKSSPAAAKPETPAADAPACAGGTASCGAPACATSSSESSAA